MNPATSVASLAAFLSLATTAQAMFSRPQVVPADRLIHGMQTYLADHPDDAEVHYALARTHYLAFLNAANVAATFLGSAVPTTQSRDSPDQLDAVPVEARRRAAEELHETELLELHFAAIEGHRDTTVEPPSLARRDALGVRSREIEEELRAAGWKVPPLSVDEMLAHATAAREGFRESLRLDEGNALYLLGLASLYEQVLAFASAGRIPGLPPGFSGLDIESVMNAYYDAFAAALDKDSRLPERPMRGLRSLVSYEAGNAWLRLAAERGKKDSDNPRVIEIQAGLEAVERLPLDNAVTPIVFSLDPVPSLDALLAPEREVLFDMRGFGHAERWSWIGPRTGLLVWDADGRGDITGGNQLFGSYTFRLFWSDGYSALSALDDDHNGELAGLELSGIAAWFDENCNGHADAGEVTGIRRLGVTAIATSATDFEGIHPRNPRGLRLRDGRVLPTWDWIAQPLDESQP